VARIPGQPAVSQPGRRRGEGTKLSTQSGRRGSPPVQMAQDDEVVRLMSGRVAGKVALITGAARGQGRGRAKAFAAELGQHNIRVNSVHLTGVNTVLFLASDESKFHYRPRDRAGRRRYGVLRWRARGTGSRRSRKAQRRAKRRLPKGVYLALVAGAEAGVTMNDNVGAFSELRFRPHVADLPRPP